MSELGLGQHRLADENLRATKRSERCEATVKRGLYRVFRCALKRGHPTRHVAQFRAGAYRWSYEEVWGEGTDPFPPPEFEDAPCDKCGGTGVMRQTKPLASPDPGDDSDQAVTTFPVTCSKCGATVNHRGKCPGGCGYAY